MAHVNPQLLLAADAEQQLQLRGLEKHAAQVEVRLHGHLRTPGLDHGHQPARGETVSERRGCGPHPAL